MRTNCPPLMCILVTTELIWDLISTLASGNTVPVARRFTARSLASALTVDTVTVGPAGADAADAGADALAPADADAELGAAGALSTGFLSLQAHKPKPTIRVHAPQEILVKFITVRFFDVRDQGCPLGRDLNSSVFQTPGSARADAVSRDSSPNFTSGVGLSTGLAPVRRALPEGQFHAVFQRNIVQRLELTVGIGAQQVQVKAV